MGLELFEHVPGLIIVPDGSGTRRAGAMDESAISASLLLAEAKVRVMVRASPNPYPNPKPSPNPSPSPSPNPDQADQETDERGDFAASLTLGMVVGDGDLATRFKRLTYAELPEENMQFLSELHALREEMVRARVRARVRV